ncbi:hypothetical protein [Planctomicrobium sp. SH527]|uniref:hypothetical protein n=1 Tax=Planctomicrobium sp. SH527 TaxID=3448123 RepID=UPI003F5B0C28
MTSNPPEVFHASQRVTALLSGMLVCALWFSGCQIQQGIQHQIQYCEPLDEACQSIHIKMAAHREWKHYVHLCPPDDPHRCYFKDGFIDGFMNVASGGQGCLPAIPPRKYWKSCYETEDGQLKIQAYFQGYPEGVQAAFETGNSRSTRLPTSIHANSSANCPSCPPTHHPQESFLFDNLNPTSAPGHADQNGPSTLEPVGPINPIPEIPAALLPQSDMNTKARLLFIPDPSE